MFKLSTNALNSPIGTAWSVCLSTVYFFVNFSVFATLQQIAFFLWKLLLIATIHDLPDVIYSTPTCLKDFVKVSRDFLVVKSIKNIMKSIFFLLITSFGSSRVSKLFFFFQIFFSYRQNESSLFSILQLNRFFWCYFLHFCCDQSLSGTYRTHCLFFDFFWYHDCTIKIISNTIIESFLRGLWSVVTFSNKEMLISKNSCANLIERIRTDSFLFLNEKLWTQKVISRY